MGMKTAVKNWVWKQNGKTEMKKCERENMNEKMGIKMGMEMWIKNRKWKMGMEKYKFKNGN